MTELLGQENTDDLKKRICDLIVYRIRQDMNAWDNFIFYPPDFKSFFDECFEEAKSKAKDEILNQLYGKIMESYHNLR